MALGQSLRDPAYQVGLAPPPRWLTDEVPAVVQIFVVGGVWDNGAMDPCRHPQRKRHAQLRHQLRHQPRVTPLWVGDPDDWAMVRREPRPPLVCPEPGCEVELISYENRNNRYNPLIFKFKSVDRSCDHWSDRGQGGGPESAQHEWMKLRLTRIAQRLGFTATPEHSPTHSDVFVHEPEFCLEVQLVPTQFDKRTAARQGKGAGVCWLICEELGTPKALQVLFELPVVRFRIIDHTNRKGRLLAPWEAPDDRDLARRARLQVFGTVAHAPPRDHRPDPAAPHAVWFRTRSPASTPSTTENCASRLAAHLDRHPDIPSATSRRPGQARVECPCGGAYPRNRSAHGSAAGCSAHPASATGSARARRSHQHQALNVDRLAAMVVLETHAVKADSR